MSMEKVLRLMKATGMNRYIIRLGISYYDVVAVGIESAWEIAKMNHMARCRKDWWKPAYAVAGRTGWIEITS